MSNRTTLMERLNKQLSEMEAVFKKLGPIEGILERMNTLEDSIYTTKMSLHSRKPVYISVYPKVCSTNLPPTK